MGFGPYVSGLATREGTSTFTLGDNILVLFHLW